MLIDGQTPVIGTDPGELLRMNMEPYYRDDLVTLYHGDNRKVTPNLSGITACVTDPPYGLGFMGKGWDHGVPGVEFWQLIAGACVPGAPLLAFGGTRTYHRLVCAIEDAGWEIRDCLQYLYGSGFPKSMNISKAIDKAAGAEREVVGHKGGRYDSPGTDIRGGKLIGGKAAAMTNLGDITAPATDAAQTWDGWGTALKPAVEMICLAMNPLDGTFANNAIEHGVAGINVDGGRIQTGDDTTTRHSSSSSSSYMTGEIGETQPKQDPYITGSTSSRWPANIIHDGSEEGVRGFPLINGESAARYFYCAKASQAERNKGCENLTMRSASECCEDREPDSVGIQSPRAGSGRTSGSRNNHPTVKPLALMRYLLTLVTMPERNLILDPFAGSGSTGVACKELGLPCVLIDDEIEHCEIIAARVAAAHFKPTQDVLAL